MTSITSIFSLTVNDTSRWYFFLIRFTIPLILAAVLWSSPDVHWWTVGFVVISVLDFVGGIVQFLWQPKLLDYRFAVARDSVYALAFYCSNLFNPHVSALILVPPVLAEIFVLFGAHIFFKAVLVEVVLLTVRMTTVHRVYHALHPGWALLIGAASLIMGLLGLVITVLEELQAKKVRNQEGLKDTLTEMLAESLSPSGIDQQFLQQESFSRMLDELCDDTCQSKGRELGKHLAQVIATKQAASHLLTSREIEVLLLMSEKKSYGQIARHLQVSEGTVRAHAASIMRKAGVHSRDELVEWGRSNRLISSSDIRSETCLDSENLIHS
ncbi:response regulator transcription factor [Alicyclobacillus curvatus]|nr:response regulator transcription factor [Alicyclobacillus curvatus]